MNAKTNAQRQKDWRDRNKAAAQGTEVRGIYAHPDDHRKIKDAADRIARKRAKAAGIPVWEPYRRPTSRR